MVPNAIAWSRVFYGMVYDVSSTLHTYDGANPRSERAVGFVITNSLTLT